MVTLSHQIKCSKGTLGTMQLFGLCPFEESIGFDLLKKTTGLTWKHWNSLLKSVMFLNDVLLFMGHFGLLVYKTQYENFHKMNFCISHVSVCLFDK